LTRRQKSFSANLVNTLLGNAAEIIALRKAHLKLSRTNMDREGSALVQCCMFPAMLLLFAG